MDEYELMEDNYGEVEVSEEQKLAIAKVESEQAMVIQAIGRLEVMAKNIKKEQDEMKKKVLEAMEKYGVKSIKNESMTISYVAPSQRVTLDSKALKDELPEVFEEYKKVSNVKSSVRIKLK